MAAVTDHDDFTAHDTTRSMIAVDTDVQEDASTLFIPSDEPTDTVGEHDAQAATEPAPTSEPMTSPKRIKAELDAPPKAVTRKRQRVNNQVPPYSDQQEKASSRLAVDQPCFKEVEKLVPMICDMIINVADDLLARGYFDDEIGNIVAKLKNYKFVHKIYKDSKPVGFLGDTAAGKSTLINCLLNLLDVAAENDDGDSGTSVAQELANAELDQSERFKAIVYYHRQRKIDDLIMKHFEDVYDHHNLDTTDLDADEQKACEDNNTTALNFFTTVLCDRNEFQSASSCAAYLAKAKSRDDKDMLSGLKGLVQAYMNTLDRQNGATTVEGATMAEVNRKLKRYKGPVKSSTDTTSQASPWPLVNKITTHLNARILSEGAVLMDLPGTSDVDKNRVRNTREYVEDCGTTVIAHPIIRAKTQDSVWANMVDCIRAGKQSSLIFVCTKTDDFNHQRDREVPEKDRIIFENLQSVVNRIDEEIEEIEDRLQEAEDNGDDSYATINGELKSRTKAKAAADAKLKEAKILMRNRSNVETIQNKFRELTRSHQEIPVFCVSNTIYQQHMRGYNMNKPPDLSVEATDIPRLRQYLFEIPAKRKLAALMKLCKNTIRRVLLAIEMQCSKTRLERKQDVECKVVKPFTCFQEQMASVKSQLKHEFERIMQDVVHTREDDWTAAAKAQHEVWVKYRWSRYGAFCRHYGVWKGLDWNVLINDICVEDYQEGFGEVKLVLNHLKTELLLNLDGLLADLDTDLTESPELTGLNLDAFHKLIEIMRQNVDENTTKLFRKLDSKVNEIRYNAISTEHPDSYVKKMMLPVYENCKLRTGKGVFAQMKEVVSKKLTGPKNIYPRNPGDYDCRLRRVCRLLVATARKDIGKDFQSIIDDFNRRFDNVEPEDETKREFRKELLDTVQKATRVMDTEMKAQLDACSVYR